VHLRGFWVDCDRSLHQAARDFHERPSRLLMSDRERTMHSHAFNLSGDLRPARRDSAR